MSATRIERDSMGEMRVPADALWGASTERARSNFGYGDRPLPRSVWRALGLLKGAVARVHAELGLLDAAKAGAHYVSPFVGRLDDIAADGMQLIRDIKAIYANYPFSTQILVASIRHPLHVIEAARIGADIATMPLAVLESLVKHPLTDAGLERFLKDWEKLPAAAKTWKGSGTASRV